VVNAEQNKSKQPHPNISLGRYGVPRVQVDHFGRAVGEGGEAADLVLQRTHARSAGLGGASCRTAEIAQDTRAERRRTPSPVGRSRRSLRPPLPGLFRRFRHLQQQVFHLQSASWHKRHMSRNITKPLDLGVSLVFDNGATGQQHSTHHRICVEFPE